MYSLGAPTQQVPWSKYCQLCMLAAVFLLSRSRSHLNECAPALGVPAKRARGSRNLIHTCGRSKYQNALAQPAEIFVGSGQHYRRSTGMRRGEEIEHALRSVQFQVLALSRVVACRAVCQYLKSVESRLRLGVLVKMKPIAVCLVRAISTLCSSTVQRMSD
jgi:hypothetical protein